MVNQQKVYQVENLQEQVKKGKSVFLLDYQGLPADLLNDLRQEIRESGGEMMVVKNSLFKRALEELDYELDDEVFRGPIACLLGIKDEVRPLSTLCDFLEDQDKQVAFKAGILIRDKQFLSPERVQDLAKLPSQAELQGQLVGNLAAPVRGLLFTLKGPQQKLVLLMKTLQEKKASEEN